MSTSPSRLLSLLGAVLVFGSLGLARQSTTAQAPAPAPNPHANEVPAPKNPPRVVTPGPMVGAPPSDAIVLFDGKDLSNWVSEKDGKSPAPWTVADGAMTVVAKSGGIQTKQSFGDVQLHIEWATPPDVKGNSQERGNSGVFLMGSSAGSGGYEVQVLDSYDNATYWHGSAGSIYKQHAPLVNASRKPGEWQVYDIVFHAPTFDAGGKVTKRATFTVFHNGVLIQDHVEVMGVTTHSGPPYYKAHPDKLPITLQDHGNPVRYRNVWVREL
jgi:hypothetical protein